MQNVGEEICGEYLRLIEKCDFISYNVLTPDVQGEIDVIGISLERLTIYVCEVAIHTGGLQYKKDNRSNDFNKCKAKFDKSIAYAKKYFPNYKSIVPMLWSPIVRVASAKAKYNPYGELLRLKDEIKKIHKLELQLFVNEHFQLALNQLKEKAFSTSQGISSPVLRIFQIETKLEKHVGLLKKRKDKSAA